MGEEINNKQTNENNDAGDKSATSKLIDRADAAAKRLEEAIAKQDALFKRQEEFEARRILGGSSEAGFAPVPVKEETSEELAQRCLRGGFNPLA